MAQENVYSASEDYFSDDSEDDYEFTHPFMNIIDKLGEEEFMRHWNSEPVQECLEKAVNRFIQDHNLDINWNKRDPLWNITETNWWIIKLHNPIREYIESNNMIFTSPADERRCYPRLREELGPKSNTIESIYWPDGGKYLKETTCALLTQALGGGIVNDDSVFQLHDIRANNLRGLVIWSSDEGNYCVSILLSCLQYMGEKYRMSERKYKERIFEIYMHTESERSETESYISDDSDYDDYDYYDFQQNWEEFYAVWKTDEIQTLVEQEIEQFADICSIEDRTWKKGEPLWNMDVTGWWDTEIAKRIKDIEDKENTHYNFTKSMQQRWGRKLTTQEISQMYTQMCYSSIKDSVKPKPGTLESLYLPNAGRFLAYPLLKTLELMYPDNEFYIRYNKKFERTEILSDEMMTRFNIAAGYTYTMDSFAGSSD